MTVRAGWLAIFLLLTMAARGEGTKVAYDDDGMIRINGERTVILGSYYAARSDRPYKELAGAGFNLVRASGREEMDQAHAAGLWTWTSAGTLDLAAFEASSAMLRDRVRAVKDHPSLVFLETVDEPAWTWMKAEARIPPRALIEAYPIIKAEDPDHLLYTNHAPANLVSTLQAYNDGTDIVACDIYPVNPGGLKHMYALFPDGRQGDLNNEHISQVGEYVDKMRRVAGPGRPVFIVLQAFAWEMLVPEEERREEKILFPTYAQQRFMAYQALIKGANGILYWGSDYMPQPSQAWSDLKRVVGEVAAHKDVLASRAAPLSVQIRYHELGHSVDEGIQWTARQRDERLFLFTCNADKNPCKVTLTGLDGWTSARVVDEERGLALETGTLTDSWKRFDVHVYELRR